MNINSLAMKNTLALLFLATTFSFSQTVTKTITGRITDGKNPLENASINVEGATKSTFSDGSGRYSVTASVGAILRYSYQGMKTVNIQIEDVTRVLNIAMVPDVEELEEVTVLGSNRKSQRELLLEYPTNLNIIKTAYGYINAETAAGKISFMHEEQINPVAICILDLLQNEFAGVRVQGNCLGAFGPGAGGQQQLTNLVGGNSNSPGVVGLAADANGGQSSLINGRVFIRGNNSIFNTRSAIFDVDGQIFTDAPIWIDVKNIKRLAILNNFATTTQYGSIGAGGVVVINTLTASPKADEIYDRARLRNNFVSDNMITEEELRRNWPNYLTELYASTSFDAAKNVYEKYAKTYSGSPYFILDVQKYFSTQWNEKAYADEIVDKAAYVFKKNPVLLKALAYQHEELGDYNAANTYYKEVLKLRPNYGQSYMDLANSYSDIKDPSQAAALYTRYSHLVEEGFMGTDTVGFGPIIEREYNNFLFLNKNAVVAGQQAKDLYIAEEEFEGTRLVFEWNDSEAEFDLQFVNPEKQYFMWKHSLASNAEIISREKEFGYSTTEYLIDSSLPGNWTVNIKYYGNKSLTPTYLKATVYYNYGSYAQRKETRVFKLSLKDVPQKLFTVSVGGKLVSR